MMYRSRCLVALLILLLGPLQACKTGQDSGGGSGGGKLRVVTGTCKVTFKTETQTHAAGAPNVLVPIGAMLETDEKGSAVVNWGMTSQILQPNSKLTFVAGSKIPGYGPSKVELLKGIASFFLPKSETADFKFQASSHSIVAAVKGTMFQMVADEAAKTAQVETMRGTVYVFARSDGAPATDTKPADAGELVAQVEKADVYLAQADGVAPRGVATTGELTPSSVTTDPARAPGGQKPALQAGLNKSVKSTSSIEEWELKQEFLLGNPILGF